MTKPRVVSLLPSATEIVFALGAGDRVVGVSHTCDYPEDVRTLPVLTKSTRKEPTPTHMVPVYPAREAPLSISPRPTGGEGHVPPPAKRGKVRRGAERATPPSTHVPQGARSQPVFALDAGRLAELAPDVILTQEICDVCAVGGASLCEILSSRMNPVPEMVTLGASTLEDILGEIETIGRAVGAEQEAEATLHDLRRRIEAVVSAVAEAPRRRVFCAEWLDPLRAAGLWTADAVRLAGGVNGFIQPGDRSRKVDWEEVHDFAPEVIMVMPCGLDLPASRSALHTLKAERSGRTGSAIANSTWETGVRSRDHLAGWSEIPAVRDGEVYVFDGRVPSRHGPRILDVLEAFAEILHPDRFQPKWHGNLYARW